VTQIAGTTLARANDGIQGVEATLMAARTGSAHAGGSSIGSVRYRRSPATLWRAYADEVLLSAPDSPDVQVLNGSATEIWSLLRVPRRAEEITDILVRTYDAPAAVVHEGVTGLLGGLRARGFVEEGQPTRG
jgi:hypothetical protein